MKHRSPLLNASLCMAFMLTSLCLVASFVEHKSVCSRQKGSELVARGGRCRRYC